MSEYDQTIQGIEKTCNALECQLKESIPIEHQYFAKEMSLGDQIDKENLEIKPSDNEKTPRSLESKIAQIEKTGKITIEFRRP